MSTQPLKVRVRHAPAFSLVATEHVLKSILRKLVVVGDKQDEQNKRAVEGEAPETESGRITGEADETVGDEVTLDRPHIRGSLCKLKHAFCVPVQQLRKELTPTSRVVSILDALSRDEPLEFGDRRKICLEFARDLKRTKFTIVEKDCEPRAVKQVPLVPPSSAQE